MNIVGISAHFHDSAACLLQDGALVAAASEERFTRVKHDPRLPVNAFRFCLEAAGLHPGDVDCVAYYEDPAKKRERQRWAAVPGTPDALHDPERSIRRHLGYDGSIATFDHHLSHAASSYFFSGFGDAAVLTVDGVGEWATTTYGRAAGAAIDLFEEVRFPHSLGLFYATITAYLGFRVNDGEYKVMGLAPYGRPRFGAEMARLLQAGPNGRFTLDMDYFDYLGGTTMYSDRLAALLGEPPRTPGAELTPFHADVAGSAQLALEEILLEKVRYLAGRVDSANLCMAGGVALNCVANGRIRREGPFDNVFIQPAAGDAGGCLGAAALAHVQLTGDRPATGPMVRADLGPEYSTAEIGRTLEAAGLAAAARSEPDLVAEVAARLERGDVVGWFDGRMEFGPRALGSRSILASPLDPDMRRRINAGVKQREAFRPFAPSVLAGHAAAHFDLDHPSPFMLETCGVTSPLELPAITHVDGSARPQTVDPAVHPRFAAVIGAFAERTGCPMVLNTSLNTAGEPIVMTPVDALLCMVRADLDALVLGDVIIDRSDVPASLAALLTAWQTRPRAAFDEGHNLYTFV